MDRIPMTMTQKILAAKANLSYVKAGDLIGHVGNTGNSDLDDYDFGQDDEDYDEETELDDADVMAEAEGEDDDA